MVLLHHFLIKFYEIFFLNYYILHKEKSILFSQLNNYYNSAKSAKNQDFSFL